MDYNLPKYGIVGLGFVGSAIKGAMTYEGNIKVVDVDPTKSTHTIDDLIDCEGIFVCVPTPQADDGVCDTSALEDVLTKLEYYNGPIISKCTAPPAFYKKLSEKYMNLVHAPEFLTAANAKQDYIRGTFAMIGGSSKAFRQEAERIIRLGQKNLVTVKHCSVEEAALAKYGINTFLATKIVFMNEMYLLCEKTGVNFNTVADLIKLDHRIGTTHMQVPGPDGFGFAGMCFPKDTSALYHYAKSNDVEMEHMKSVIEANKKLRNIPSNQD